MASYKRKLKDREGNFVLPATRSTCVYMNSGIDLQTYLDNLSDNLQAHWDEMLTKDALYPVGAIYHSTSSTSPASLFGGSWERFTDRFLVGAGGTYAVNAMGGEASHTLTTWEMPTHNHGFVNGSYTIGNSTTGWEGDTNVVIEGHEDYIACWKTGPLGRPTSLFISQFQHNHTLDGGNNGAHNNLPPYYAVNIWRRTA